MSRPAIGNFCNPRNSVIYCVLPTCPERGLTMHGRLLLTFAVAAFVPSAPVYAQAPETDAVAPAHVAHVDGPVSLEREGRTESSPLNMPLLSGDRLRTGEDGRVEVLFADGSTLHLDMRSRLAVQSEAL